MAPARGVPFSAAQGDAAPSAAPAKRKAKAAPTDAGGDEAEAMTHLMLPRKKKELYKAMQMGIAKKKEAVAKLKSKRAKLQGEEEKLTIVD